MGIIQLVVCISEANAYIYIYVHVLKSFFKLLLDILTHVLYWIELVVT